MDGHHGRGRFAPQYRSRLAGREYNNYRDDSLYASTPPPIEALRVVLSYAASFQLMMCLEMRSW